MVHEGFNHFIIDRIVPPVKWGIIPSRLGVRDPTLRDHSSCTQEYMRGMVIRSLLRRNSGERKYASRGYGGRPVLIKGIKPLSMWRKDSIRSSY